MPKGLGYRGGDANTKKQAIYRKKAGHAGNGMKVKKESKYRKEAGSKGGGFGSQSVYRS